MINWKNLRLVIMIWCKMLRLRESFTRVSLIWLMLCLKFVKFILIVMILSLIGQTQSWIRMLNLSLLILDTFMIERCLKIFKICEEWRRKKSNFSKIRSFELVTNFASFASKKVKVSNIVWKKNAMNYLVNEY